MKTLRALSSAVVLVILSSSLAQAQEEFPKPGPEHQLLKQMAGKWAGDVKFYFDAEGAPMESQGEFVAKMDVGGFFLITEYKSEFGDQPFQGRGIMGYNTFDKKYAGVWVDSMSPAIFTTVGEWDKAGKVYTEIMEGPGHDGKPLKMRIVTRIKDTNNMDVTMFTIEEGKEKQMMEIAYTRKKKKK